MSQKTETAGEKRPDPPAPLSKEKKKVWTGVFERKNLQPHEILILAKACEAFDRGEQARQILDKEGFTFEDRFGQPRARPEVAIERDSRAQFAKLLSQIHLHSPQAW